MKKVASYWWMLCAAAFVFVSCEQSNQGPEQNSELLTLEDAVNQAALNIDIAVDAIESSYAYGLFNHSSTIKSGNSEDAPAHTIYLEDIAGVYEYSPVEEEDGASVLKSKCKSYFKKIEDNEHLILHLPFEKVKKPASLFKFEPDDEWTNNFKITTSQFLYEADKMLSGHNYQLATRFDVDDEYAGELWVNETRSEYFKIKSTSKFGFTDEYFIKVTTQFGDTTMLSYCLENADEEKLYSETGSLVINMNEGKPTTELAYEMQVGDVRIVKTLNDEKQIVYMVYKAGELQEDAVVEEVSSEDDSLNGVNCLFMHKNKDLRITFADETTVLLSELIGDSQDVLSELFNSMKELYLSKKIVNKLAWQIYREEMCDDSED